MTVQDLLDIALAEGRNPVEMHLVIGVGGEAFDVDASDDQDPFNPTWLMLTLHPKVTA